MSAVNDLIKEIAKAPPEVIHAVEALVSAIANGENVQRVALDLAAARLEAEGRKRILAGKL